MMKLDPDRNRVAIRQLVSGSPDYLAVAHRMVEQLEREVKQIPTYRSPFNGKYAIRLEVIPMTLSPDEE